MDQRRFIPHFVGCANIQVTIRKGITLYFYNMTEKNLLPYNSVYAHGGADLRNDEFIVRRVKHIFINHQQNH